MSRFGRFWWDFVVGDDWRVAAGVVVGVGVEAALVALGVAAWWFLPVAVAVLLLLTVRWEVLRLERDGR